jgi:hypothetical protein
LDVPIHQGKMEAEHAAAMWSDAGIGVAAQRVVIKHFVDFFRCKFAVPEAAINHLASDSMPPVVATTEHTDKILDHWCKDLVVLLPGQIGREHENQPAGFLHASVDFVIGADHGQQVFFCAGVKVACRNADRKAKATAVYELGEIECKKDTGELLALAFTPKLNAALKRIINCERDAHGKLVGDGWDAHSAQVKTRSRRRRGPGSRRQRMPLFSLHLGQNRTIVPT